MGYFLDMENNQKPEWFELAENDQPVSRPLKKKSAPKRSLTLILAGILVIPMGAGFALLTHEDHSAVAVETLNSTQDSPAATSSAQTMTSNAISMPTASREDDDDEEGDDDDYRAPVFSNSSSNSPTVSVAPAPAPAAKAPAAKAPAAITPPGSASTDIILPPTKKGDDDDDDDDDDDEEDEDDDDKKSHGKKSKDSDDDEDDD